MTADRCEGIRIFEWLESCSADCTEVLLHPHFLQHRKTAVHHLRLRFRLLVRHSALKESSAVSSLDSQISDSSDVPSSCALFVPRLSEGHNYNASEKLSSETFYGLRLMQTLNISSRASSKTYYILLNSLVLKTCTALYPQREKISHPLAAFGKEITRLLDRCCVETFLPFYVNE